MKDLSTFLNESLICESYKDVTGNEFQGIYGGYSAKIYKPGKYIIRLHDFRWEEKCYKDPVLGPICKKMDELKPGSKEYKQAEAEYNRLFDEKFGPDSDAWTPKKVDIVKIYYNSDKGIECGADVIYTADKRWYSYSNTDRSFETLPKSEVEEYMATGDYGVIE